MSAEGGGWTLVLNQGVEFDPSVFGTSSALGFEGKGTNLSYSSVPLEADVMLDVRLEPIVAETHTARAVIIGVHPETRGHTLRDLFTSGPHYLEAEDNSNLTLRSTIECNFSPTDLPSLLCDSCEQGNGCAVPVFVFGDQDPSCTGSPRVFAISGARSHSERWDNCAGWPQATVVGGQRHFPDNFRLWVR